MEDQITPLVEHYRRLNPIIKEVIKWLKVGFIYAISDSVWVSIMHMVPKKGGMLVVKNEKNEFISTRIMIRWRVCIDYRN